MSTIKSIQCCVPGCKEKILFESESNVNTYKVKLKNSSTAQKRDNRKNTLSQEDVNNNEILVYYKCPNGHLRPYKAKVYDEKKSEKICILIYAYNQCIKKIENILFVKKYLWRKIEKTKRIIIVEGEKKVESENGDEIKNLEEYELERKPKKLYEELIDILNNSQEKIKIVDKNVVKNKLINIYEISKYIVSILREKLKNPAERNIGQKNKEIELTENDKTEIMDDYTIMKNSKKMYENSNEVFKTATEKLVKSVEWFWSIYTGAYVTGLLTNYLNVSSLQTVVFSLPVLLLPISYFLCVKAQMPDHSSAFSNVPSSIIKCDEEINKKKDKKIHYALIFVFISVLSLSISLLFLSIEKMKVANEVFAFYDYNKSEVVITGHLPEKTKLYSSVKGIYNDTIIKEIRTDTILVRDNKSFNYYLPVEKMQRGFIVNIFWKEKEAEKEFTKVLKY